MNVNFTSKLIIQDDLSKTLKKSNIEDIIRKTRHIVESPFVSKTIEGDVVLSSLKNGFQGDKLLMICENDKIEFCSKNSIKPMTVINQILLHICAKYNIQPRSLKTEHMIDALKKISIK